MNIGSAFSKAWKDLKAAAVKTEDFVAKNAPEIEAGTTAVSTIIDTADPAAKPAVTAFDDLETLLLGHVTASMAGSKGNPANTPTMVVSANGSVTAKPGATFTVTLPAELYPALSSIAQMLASQPAVMAAQK